MKVFAIPQLTQVGVVEEKDQLPSFIYRPHQAELSSDLATWEGITVPSSVVGNGDGTETVFNDGSGADEEERLEFILNGPWRSPAALDARGRAFLQYLPPTTDPETVGKAHFGFTVEQVVAKAKGLIG